MGYCIRFPLVQMNRLSGYSSNFRSADVMNPVVNVLISGRGRNGGWFGWPEDARIEAMRDALARSSSPDERKTIAADIQREAYD